MPPFVGPSTVECCTRYPAKQRYSPLSRRTGIETITARSGKRSRSATATLAAAFGSACSNCVSACRKSGVSHSNSGSTTVSVTRRSVGQAIPTIAASVPIESRWFGAILSRPGWRNWRYAADLKSAVPDGGVRVRLPPPALGPAALRAGCQGIHREALRPFAPIRVAEGLERLLVEGRADGDVPFAQLARRRRPGRDGDLAAEAGIGRAEHRVWVRRVERAQLVDGRLRHLVSPPEDDAPVLLVVDDLDRVGRGRVEVPDRGLVVVAAVRRRRRVVLDRRVEARDVLAALRSSRLQRAPGVPHRGLDARARGAACREVDHRDDDRERDEAGRGKDHEPLQLALVFRRPPRARGAPLRRLNGPPRRRGRARLLRHGARG